MASKRPIVLAVVADPHANSLVGLCPDDGVKRKNGGKYLPSPAQLWLWEAYMDWWAWVERLRSKHKAKGYLLANGDLVDGTVHHGNTEQVSTSGHDMMYLAKQVLLPARTWARKHSGKMWVTRGTASHVGDGPEDELGKWFGAEREPVTDQWARQIVKFDLYGVRIDARHHAPTGTSRPWLRGNPANIMAAMVYMEHKMAGYPHPHLAIRSHKHKFSMSGKNFPTEGVITPAWQLQTDWVHQVVPESIADVGGVAVLITPDGEYALYHKTYTPEPPATYREA